jgi:hypothetical protein
VRLPVLERLWHIVRVVFLSRGETLRCIREAALDTNAASIKAEIAARLPQALVLHGYKVYSQCDEDGIIARLFELLGEGNRLFVEIGCGNGRENNTHNLLVRGWRGVWVDGDDGNVARIRRDLNYTPNEVLSVLQAFVDARNVNGIVQRGLEQIGVKQFPAEVDFCSIDIDGNELFVWQALNVIRPRVLCIEYNARFPPPMEVAIEYRAGHRYAGDDYQGASLQSLANVLHPAGYCLAACNISGVNAFFVRAGTLPSLEPIDLKQIYMPPRHYMVAAQPGLRASLKYVRDRIAKAKVR